MISHTLGGNRVILFMRVMVLQCAQGARYLRPICFVCYRSQDDLISSANTLSTSIPFDNGSSTVLDMQALDAQESRKMKDDSKIHHILDDAMFKIRKRVSTNYYYRILVP